MRSTAQMISYEISISITLIPIFFLSSSLNLVKVVENQVNGYYFLPLLPLAIIFLISIFAETNRTPFDLPEAEAELVAGFNLEYSSIVFALFFLAEYSNIMLMSALFSILFLGGWVGILSFNNLIFLIVKTLLICFLFVLVRANLPRYRYDQLMSIGWKVFLPSSFSFTCLYLFYFYTINLVPETPYVFLNIIKII
jgi:NADH-quinone oxidoreductase subunit H